MIARRLTTRWMTAAAFSLVVSLAWAAPPSASGPPNALQGFSQNRKEPIKIESASLEVRDKDKLATFAGQVQLVQGDTVLHCDSLLVFYDTEAKTAAASDSTAGQQNIRRIEVRGNVVVTQKDQKATAENGFFDMKSNTITLVGNVVISQGPNVVRGDRLVVDMTTSVSRMECDKGSSCRVQALLQPNKDSSAAAPDLSFGRKPRPTNPSGL